MLAHLTPARAQATLDDLYLEMQTQTGFLSTIDGDTDATYALLAAWQAADALYWGTVTSELATIAGQFSTLNANLVDGFATANGHLYTISTDGTASREALESLDANFQTHMAAFDQLATDLNLHLNDIKDYLEDAEGNPILLTIKNQLVTINDNVALIELHTADIDDNTDEVEALLAEIRDNTAELGGGGGGDPLPTLEDILEKLEQTRQEQEDQGWDEHPGYDSDNPEEPDPESNTKKGAKYQKKLYEEWKKSEYPEGLPGMPAIDPLVIEPTMPTITSEQYSIPIDFYWHLTDDSCMATYTFKTIPEMGDFGGEQLLTLIGVFRSMTAVFFFLCFIGAIFKTMF